MEYRTTEGLGKRVHKEYVDVVASFAKNGILEPLIVRWKDGRSFLIDEVLLAEPFGPVLRGRQTKRYRVRLKDHETELFLERKEAQLALGKPEELRWWVYAFDKAVSANTATGNTGHNSNAAGSGVCSGNTYSTGRASSGNTYSTSAGNSSAKA